ncbi:MAG: thermonuclease family protein [Promethearchaeota archaeon]|jgi:micrococcal nuclease
MLTTVKEFESSDLYFYKGFVCGVYDGDTLTVSLDLGIEISKKIKVRLLGVDTPELRLEEREEGLKVRDYVRGLVLQKEVLIKTYKDKTGKYGRYLAEIFIEQEDGTYLNLSAHLLELGFAKPY